MSYFINRSVCIKCHKKIANLHFDKICSTCYFAEILELPSAEIIELPSAEIIEISEWSIIADKESLLEMPDFLPNLLNYTESPKPVETSTIVPETVETSDILAESSITETVPSTPPELLLENHLIRSEAALTPNLRPA